MKYYSMYTSDECSIVRKQLEALSEKFQDQELKLTKLQDHVQGLTTKCDFVRDAFTKALIANIVGELLLFVIGEQPKKNKGSNHFFKETNSKGEDITDRIEAIVKLFKGTIANKKFKTIANKMIDQRNSQSHCSSVKQLKERVEQAVQAFVAYPELMQTMSTEYKILTKFNNIETKVLSIPCNKKA